jgi:hypothetical protein
VNAPDLLDVLEGYADALRVGTLGKQMQVNAWASAARLQVENAKLKGQLKAIRQWAKVPKATAKKGKATT